MPETGRAWHGLWIWVVIALIGVSNFVEGDTVIGAGLVIAGCCHAAGGSIDEERPRYASGLRTAGAGGAVLALLGVATNLL